jgi:hypothetical protein
VSWTDRGAELVIMTVRTVYHQYAFARKDEPTATIAEHVWQFCLRGIGGRTEGRDAPSQPSNSKRNDTSPAGLRTTPRFANKAAGLVITVAD